MVMKYELAGGEVFVWGLFFGEKNHTPISIEFKDEVIVDCVCGEKNLFAISRLLFLFILITITKKLI